MNAMDAATTREVVGDLGTETARERLNQGTGRPTTGKVAGLFARIGRAFKRYLAQRRLADELSTMPPHLVRDLGLDPDSLNHSIGRRLNEMLAEREMQIRRSRLDA